MKAFAPWRLGAALVIGLSAAVLASCGGGGGGVPDQARMAPATPVADMADSRMLPPELARPEPSLRGRDPQAKPPAGLTKFALAALEPQALRKATAMNGMPGRARHIGVHRSLDAAKAGALRWRVGALGGKQAALQLSSAQALGLRAGLLVDQLPDLAVVRVYAPGASFQHVFGGLEINQVIARNRDAGETGLDGRTWWAPYIEGESLVLEIEVPAGIDASQVQLSVPRVSHFFESPRALAEAKISVGESALCNLDAACYPANQAQRNAVAHIVFSTGTGQAVCTGTLLADTAGTATPWFLTANHCVSTQAAASSVETHWFGDSAQCNQRTTVSPAYTTRTGGGSLLFTSRTNDLTFMRLAATLPAGVAFAAWHAGAPALGVDATGIHHPKGDLKKISFGRTTEYCNTSYSTDGFDASGSFSTTCGQSSAAPFVNVEFTQGTTESGSSGSAIWIDVAGQPRVVGVLLGGNSSCTLQNGSNLYGRFDLFYESALKQYLNPASTGGAAPQTGWWWNATESGRGFAIELRGNTIFMAGFMYAEDGRDAWYAGTLTRQVAGNYTGELRSYQGGNDRVQSQTARGPTANSLAANVDLTASSATAMNVRVSLGSQTRDIALVRFPISTPGFAASNATFESGWWWNPAESGHGYFIETQGGSTFSAIYTYNATSAESAWYVHGAVLGSGNNQFTERTLTYRGGQTLFGSYRAATSTGSVNMTFNATSATTGAITYSNGVTVNLQRFVF